MTFTVDTAFSPRTGAELAAVWDLDPMDDDRGDYLVVDRLEVLRIVLVAAEAGARFQRDGLARDPLGWMISPADLFGGRPPIEACRRRDACSLALFVHGLGLPADIGPVALNALVGDAGLLPPGLEEGWLP